jgi:hypothetical protein
VLVLALGSAVASLKRNDPEVDLTIEMPVSTLAEVLKAEDHGQAVVNEQGTISSAVTENDPVSTAEDGQDVGNQEPVKTEGHSNGFNPDVEVFRPEFATIMPGAEVLSVAQDRIISEKGQDEYLDKAIWLVEKGPESELYSNGLQILTDYTVGNEPRGYYRFPRGTDGLPSRNDVTDKIVGILYHAAESDMIDFKPEKNDSLNRYSKALVRYIQRNKSYNYFIDRFGRVYRIVREDHAAHHAGWSVWADKEWAYLNLNHAFLGICFEGKDFYQNEGKADRARISPMGGSMINEGQLTSGRKLTDWLRVKYRIGQHNCVTHGLASVNPHKMLIGYHLDLATGFPFERFGLKDKTKVQLPAVTDFGFKYDDHFIQVFDGDLWDGIAYSEDYLRHHAEMAGMSEPEYRQVLANHFSRWFELYQDLHGQTHITAFPPL